MTTRQKRSQTAGAQGKPARGLKRIPKSDKASALVAAILQSTTALLDECGLEGFTTNHVARRAGVSIGSLYYYFPDKMAIVCELARELEVQMVERANAAMAQLSLQMQLSDGVPQPRAMAAILIDLAVAPDLGTFRLRRVLQTQVPARMLEDLAVPFDEAVVTFLSQFLMACPGVRPGDQRLRAFILLHACEAVVEAAVRRQPSLLDNGVLREELIELAAGFVTAEPAATDTASSASGTAYDGRTGVRAKICPR